MGSCCSNDRKAGRQAVGEVDHRAHRTDGGGGGVSNETADAVASLLNSRGQIALFSQIELSLSAHNLLNRDILSKSDPMAVLYVKRRDGRLEEIDRTEVLLNSLNPQWITKLRVTYQFEVVQPLVFRIYDIDSQFHKVSVKMLKLEDQQFLGEACCTLSEIVSKRTRSLTMNIDHKQSKGANSQLTVHAEEHSNSRVTLEILLRCSDLTNNDVFSKSDPFLVISKITDNGIVVPICKTEVIKNDLNPIWKPIVLNLQQIGYKDKPLVIECFDFNSNGKHDLIGKVEKSFEDLERLHDSKRGENLFLPTSAGQKVLKSNLYVDQLSERTRKTFLDYIGSGCEMNFMVAIDFTASNGNPRLPDSLHYMDPSGRPNAYQRAILEVGDVLQFYDTDKRFPAWGFGARPIDGPVSHCFNLNGSTQNYEVDGIEGIMSAYSSALHNVSLAGPTLFAPVINAASQIASQTLDQLKYFVLLIITDGVITDSQETINALVRASNMPLSILIVGVGGADFKEMEVLDADKERLHSSTGQLASRDIVQFVPLGDTHAQGGEISVIQSLLAELPEQFLSYMETRNSTPIN